MVEASEAVIGSSGRSTQVWVFAAESTLWMGFASETSWSLDSTERNRLTSSKSSRSVTVEDTEEDRDRAGREVGSGRLSKERDIVNVQLQYRIIVALRGIGRSSKAICLGLGLSR